MRLVTLFQRLLSNQSGATAVEYGLIVALVAATILSAIQLLGGNISAVLIMIAEAVTQA